MVLQLLLLWIGRSKLLLGWMQQQFRRLYPGMCPRVLQQWWLTCLGQWGLLC
jgi:hypothetical protein